LVSKLERGHMAKLERGHMAVRTGTYGSENGDMW